MLFNELLKVAAEGDKQALGILYQMYQPRIIIMMSMLNDEFDEDLHQEQMICYWRCVKKFY
ncbi:MAG: helix-turn-helix domain-containing protein [Clostridia bacterium]|nr:helix-turn-helix domain-containing protein [Clostridia bacterium]